MLYRRNPEAFLLQAYSDLIGIHKDESITLDFLSMNYNYGESLEQGEVAADLEKLSNSNIRTELQRYLQSNSH